MAALEIMSLRPAACRVNGGSTRRSPDLRSLGLNPVHFVLTASLATLVATSCRPARQPIRVVVAFENAWTCGGTGVSASEQALVKRTALQTLRRAYQGFRVEFSERHPASDVSGRVIKVEDTPYSRPPLLSLGAAGMTFPTTLVSSVRFDVLCAAALSAARCSSAARCETKTREQLLEGLGRGVGATAAHELGHQAGFEFAIHSSCEDCYDGRSAATVVHFFGVKHWSDPALVRMRRVLPST